MAALEGGASARVNLFQRFLQLQQVVGEILVEIILVVKIHHEYFVVRIAGPHQVERGLVHLVPLSRMEPELSMMMRIETGISS